MLIWCIYPGWLDVIFIVLLYTIKKRHAIEGIESYATVLAVGLVRFLIHLSIVGLSSDSTKNWYIKQAIIFSIAISVVFLYEQKTFTWLFAVYYSELLFFELLVSIYKGALKNGYR
jgi:hypothetical protein